MLGIFIGLALCLEIYLTYSRAPKISSNSPPSEYHTPTPVKLGPKTTMWRVEDILALMERVSATHHPPLAKSASPAEKKLGGGDA